MRRHVLETLFSALLACSALAWAPVARADVTVTVLSLSSVEGDDEFARNLSGALRNAASNVRGWIVDPDREVALSQMELTHDCSSSDSICMAQIAATLASQRVIYGSIQRSPIGTRFEFQVTLFLFDAESGEVVDRIVETIPSTSVDIDALREPAREIIERISASMRPGSIRVVGRAGASVVIDGEAVGVIPSGGTYTREDVDAGDHTVSVDGEAEQTIAVAGGTEAVATFTTGGGDDGGGGGSVLPWIGAGLLGVAAVSLGVWIYSMVRLDQLSSDANYERFRRDVGAMNPTATSVCDSAYFNATLDPRGVGNSTCSEGATMEILQYVFLGLAVVSAGAGTALVVVGFGEGSSSSSDSARLRLDPTRLTIEF
jgi:hypothetical protein